MKKHFGTKPKDLKAAFGPAIQKCCYQMGLEFKKYFPKEVTVVNGAPTVLLRFCAAKRSRGGLFFDLPLTNKHQLLALGVKEKNIFDCRICTSCNPRFFSFRREGKKAGRMISLMMLKF